MIANVNANHWVVLHADLKAQNIEVLDSWEQTRRTDISLHNWQKSVHKDLVEVLVPYYYKSPGAEICRTRKLSSRR